MGTERISHYKHTCDLCGVSRVVESDESSDFPKGWLVLSIGVAPEEEEEMLACSGCVARYREAIAQLRADCKSLPGEEP